MFKSIKQLFSQPLGASQQDLPAEHQLRLAAAALMIEIANADFRVEAAELQRIESLLQDSLHLSEDEIIALVSMAQQESQEATSLHEFTRLINEHYRAEDKRRLLEQLWRVAYADGDLDRYEEYTLRKISDLLYVPHKDFIQTKLKVLASLRKP